MTRAPALRSPGHSAVEDARERAGGRARLAGTTATDIPLTESSGPTLRAGRFFCLPAAHAERMRQFPVGAVTNIGVKTAQRMPTARYYKEQARALLTWARATGDKAYADQLRVHAAKEFERAE